MGALTGLLVEAAREEGGAALAWGDGRRVSPRRLVLPASGRVRVTYRGDTVFRIVQGGTARAWSLGGMGMGGMM